MVSVHGMARHAQTRMTRRIHSPAVTAANGVPPSHSCEAASAAGTSGPHVSAVLCGHPVTSLEGDGLRHDPSRGLGRGIGGASARCTVAIYRDISGWLSADERRSAGDPSATQGYFARRAFGTSASLPACRHFGPPASPGLTRPHGHQALRQREGTTRPPSG